MNIDLKEAFKDLNINSETAVKAMKDYCEKELEIARMRHEIKKSEEERNNEYQKHSIISGYIAWVVFPCLAIMLLLIIASSIKGG